MAFGSEFTWEVEHRSLPAAQLRMKRMYEEQTKRPYPGQIDTSKPKTWYSRNVVSILSRDAFFARKETSDDVGFASTSVEEWLCPGNQLCYVTSLQNKDVTIHKAERMPALNLMAGMVGFLQHWVSDPAFEVTPPAADLVLPENARQDGPPQLRIGLPGLTDGVFVWFDPTRRAIRRVRLIGEGRVASQWIALTDRYIDDVWPEYIEVIYFEKGEAQVREWWMLKGVKKDAVKSVPAEPALDGLRNMKDMTGPSPRIIPLDRPDTPPPVIKPAR